MKRGKEALRKEVKVGQTKGPRKRMSEKEEREEALKREMKVGQRRVQEKGKE